MKSVGLVLLFVTGALARPSSPVSYRTAPAQEAGVYGEQPARYDYNWTVKDDYSGNNYGQNENRDGAVTSGSYFVLLPDGRIQRVTYTVDGQSGFVAHVTYETPGGGYSNPSPKPVIVTAARPAYKG